MGVKGLPIPEKMGVVLVHSQEPHVAVGALGPLHLVAQSNVLVHRLMPDQRPLETVLHLLILIAFASVLDIFKGLD